MRIAIDVSTDPWKTWHHSLYRVDPDTFVTTNEDIKMVEWNPEIGILPQTSDKLLVYVGDLNEFSTFESIVAPMNVLVVTDSDSVAEACAGFDIPYKIWNRPTRVPKPMWGCMDTRKEKFTMTCDASLPINQIEKVIKTYFAMCLYETEDGEMLSNVDFEVYSAQELPVEPFNNLYFMGLQPNPTMFRGVKNSRLFISPNAENSISINVVDALYLGTPVIMRETLTSKEKFGYLGNQAFFADEKELARKIKFYKEVDDSEIYEVARIMHHKTVKELKRHDPKVCGSQLKQIAEEFFDG